MRNIYFLVIGFFVTFFPNINGFGQQVEISLVLEKARNFANSEINDSAIIYADQVLQLSERYNDTLSKIKALGIKGKSLIGIEKYIEATDLFFTALKFCKSPAHDKQIAFIYSEIGYIYNAQGHFPEAREYYEKELALRKRLEQDKEVANALINIAAMCRQQKEYTIAFKAMNELSTILLGKHDTATDGYYYTNRGVLLESTGNLDSAKFYYHKAYDDWKAINRESEIFKVTFNLGYLAAEKKNYKEALKYYYLSVASADKYGLLREIAHVNGTIAEAYAGLNDYKNAYKYLYKYATLTDSFNKMDFNNYVLKLDKQFQTEKNRETIQEQRLKLDENNIKIQKQRNLVLWITLLLVIVLFIGIAVFVYSTFRNKVKKRVEAAKSRFFENVVHEIRTPLSMIQAPIKLLQDKTTDADILYQLDIAGRNTIRLNDLLTQMLSLSKIDSGKFQLNEGYGNLYSFLNELIEPFGSQAVEKQLKLDKQLDINDVYVLFDSDALEKIITNLVSNAIKYSVPGGSIGIDATGALKEGIYEMCLTVWDTGTGIRKEEQEKIFDRFYRTDEQQKSGTKGIGIGLSLVKTLVELMKGSIQVESEPGKGSAFTVRIPLKLKEEPIQNSQAVKPTGYIVLLVEDDNEILDFNKRLLTENGYIVITAATGIEASRILKEQLPDLVITDLMMPGKSGIELIKEIRADVLTSYIPVIILSAKTNSQSKTEGVTEGAQAYLTKPFQPAELVALVKNQLLLLQKQSKADPTIHAENEKSIEEKFSGSYPFTKKCYNIIIEHLNDDRFSVERLAELMNINRSHFQRKIKTLTGYSPSELIRNIRLKTAKEMLLKKEGNITEIAYSAGFTSQSYFTKCFSDHFGHPPGKLNKQE